MSDAVLWAGWLACVLACAAARGYRTDRVLLVYFPNDITDLLPDWQASLARIRGERSRLHALLRGSYALDLAWWRLRLARIDRFWRDAAVPHLDLGPHFAGRDPATLVASRFDEHPNARAYAEIADYSWSEYLYAFVLPYYRDRRRLVASAEDLVRENDLRTLAGALRGNPSLRVFANANDFITSDEDVAWLVREIGPEHVSLFPTGGHLGNLYRPSVQDAIMDSIAVLR